MTRSKRVFAEMLVKAQGGEDVSVDEICENLTLADIMYELKKLEKEAEAAAEPEPEPVVTVKEPEPVVTVKEPEPVVTVKEPDSGFFREPTNFWSRLSGEE
jgi:hypothetical protein